jgi:hypothetical protein
MVPSCVIEALVTSSAAKAAIPFGRLFFFHDLAGFPVSEERCDTSEQAKAEQLPVCNALSQMQPVLM